MVVVVGHGSDIAEPRDRAVHAFVSASVAAFSLEGCCLPHDRQQGLL